MMEVLVPLLQHARPVQDPGRAFRLHAQLQFRQLHLPPPDSLLVLNHACLLPARTSLEMVLNGQAHFRPPGRRSGALTAKGLSATERTCSARETPSRSFE